MDAFAVCVPLWFQVFHLLSAMSLPLRLIHCCLDTRPLKVIKKSLSSCVQSLCLRKQFSGSSTRKITLLVQTLSFIREGEAGAPGLLALSLRGTVLLPDPPSSRRLCWVGCGLWASGPCGASTLGLGSHRSSCHFPAKPWNP